MSLYPLCSNLKKKRKKSVQNELQETDDFVFLFCVHIYLKIDTCWLIKSQLFFLCWGHYNKTYGISQTFMQIWLGFLAVLGSLIIIQSEYGTGGVE